MEKHTYRPYPGALLNPRCDAIFKALFTDNSDQGRLALKSLLEAVLQAEVSDVRLVQNEIPIEAESDKQAVFDIACTLNGTEAANIEMQGISAALSYGKRAEYHAAHLLNHFTPKGTGWGSIPKVFQISVLNFTYDDSSASAVSLYRLQTDDCRRLSDRLSVIFIELPKLASDSDETKNLTAAEKWGKFLLYADDEKRRGYIQELCSQEEGIMAAQGILSKISQDDINWAIETSRAKWQGDYITGMTEAREQGLSQGRAEAQAEIEALKAEVDSLRAQLSAN